MLSEVVLAFATVFGPSHMDEFNPNSSLACARTVFGRSKQLDTETFAVASYKYPCGTRLLICRAERCVMAQVLDRGPRRSRVYTNDLDLSVALARALGLGNSRGQTVCRDVHRFRGCPVFYVVDRYAPLRS